MADPSLLRILQEKGLMELAVKQGLIDNKAHDTLKEFITEDVYTKTQLALAEHLSNYNDPVLIHGETGTGKEIIAHALHGDRKGNFVPFNCTAIPDTLVDSILFGHVRGAFTGADTDRTGLAKNADNGTLFIDEIGEMPITMQAKLLRVLQERKVRPVGSLTEHPISCRIICATHRDLWKMTEAGLFREDLFWRISTYVVSIPPLRNRPNDIREMVHRKLDSAFKITEEELDVLCALPLSGNFRELESRVKRLLLEKELSLKKA